MGRRRPRGSRRNRSVSGTNQPVIPNPERAVSLSSGENISTSTSTSRPPEDSIRGISEYLGYYGFILVLLETPSGFAIFSMDGVHLYLPEAIDNIWANFTEESKAKKIIRLKEFRTFKCKSSAIRLDTGVDKKLAAMIKNCRHPEQRLAVEKPEYKEAIEKYLDIPCLHDESVMEVMWGLKHLMNIVVPYEPSELAKEDCLPVSVGLRNLLASQGYHVKPEIVNECIISKAGVLFDCVSLEKNFMFLRNVADYLKDVYGINTQDWGLVELAAALKMISDPGEDDPQKMFSADDIRLFKNVSECGDRIFLKQLCTRINKEVDSTSALKLKKLKTEEELTTLIREAETEQTKGKCKVIKHC